MAHYSNRRGVVTKGHMRQVRNEHLIPEIRKRSSRILAQVVEEEQAALAVYPAYGEYWSRLTHGRICSCQREVQEDYVGSSNLSLEQFIHLQAAELPDQFANCPVCFGARFVGGYKRIGTKLMVLDATAKPRLHKTTADIQDTAYFYRPSNRWGKVSWRVRIPSTMLEIGDVAIRWLEEPADWRFKINDVDFTKDELEGAEGTVADIVLEMKDSTNSNAGVYAIFIQFIVKEAVIPIDIPIPRQNSTGDFNVPGEPDGNVAINFKGMTSKAGDIIVDSYGYIWRIITVGEISPMGQKIATSADARLIRHFEPQYVLPSRAINNYYPRDIFTFVK